MPAKNSQQGMPDMSNLLESLIGEMPGMKDLPPDEKKKMKNAIKATSEKVQSLDLEGIFKNALSDNTGSHGKRTSPAAALNALTSGAGNTVIGYQSGDALTTSGYNTVVGYQALTTEDVGTHSTAIGYQALYSQNTASAGVAGNTAVGLESGYHNVTGVNNTYLGYKSGTGASGESNSNNVAVGQSSLLAIMGFELIESDIFLVYSTLPFIAEQTIK